VKDENLSTWIGVAASLGLVPILIVVIGRLWTATYFRALGLPASGLDFTIYDFAFRSLEALICLMLGAIGLSAAWLNRRHLRRWGFWTAGLETVIVVILLLVAILLVPKLPSDWLATTGLLGLFSGLPLAGMLWLAVDVWEGPGGGLRRWPRLGRRFALCTTNCSLALWHRWLRYVRLVRRGWRAIRVAMRGGPPPLGKKPPVGLVLQTRLREHPAKNARYAFVLASRKLTGIGRAATAPWRRAWGRLLGDSWQPAVSRVQFAKGRHLMGTAEARVRLAWRIVAVLGVVAIGFVYLPRIAEKYASIEAIVDVETQRFKAAILLSETDLPATISSASDSKKSRELRVILSTSQYTYILHSTQCTAIGDFEDTTVLVAQVAPPGTPDICRVFTIPTDRLLAIEYFQVGRAPANDSFVLAKDIKLTSESEPFANQFTSKHSSDEADLRCPQPQEDGVDGEEATDVLFRNTVWFGFTPPTSGAVLVRVVSAEFTPITGIWRASDDRDATSVRLDEIVGSGHDASEERLGIACQLTSESIGNDDQEVVGVLGNVTAGTSYLVAVGATEDNEGDFRLTVQYFPNAIYVPVRSASQDSPEPTPTQGPAFERSLAFEDPTIEIPVGSGAVSLEIWRFDTADFQVKLRASSDRIGQFEMQPESGQPVELRNRGNSSSLGPTESATEDGIVDEVAGVQSDGLILSADLDMGEWSLVSPPGFSGLVRLSTSVYPDVLLSLEGVSDPSLSDACTQSALLSEIKASIELGTVDYRGDLVAPKPESCENAESFSDLLAEDEGLADAIASVIVQVQSEGASSTLAAIAEATHDELLALGFQSSVEGCTATCIRVAFQEVDQ
jgi:hypothetical protein